MPELTMQAAETIDRLRERLAAMTDGVKRIAAERERQIAVEGWTPGHDDEHIGEELAVVAALYATPTPLYEKREVFDGTRFVDPWPESWDRGWDKRPRSARTDELKTPTRRQRIRMLEKAGALIAAEIDRLLRAKGGGR